MGNLLDGKGLNFVPATAETKIMRYRFTENTIKKVYLMPFTITAEVKIIMFQYDEVIHNGLPTRATLYRDAISEKNPYATRATQKNKRCIT